MIALAWFWFAVVQFVMLLSAAVGVLVLAPFCYFHAWKTSPTPSINATRSPTIDEWAWKPLNWVFGNPEDGVSGQQALVWLNGTTQAPYMPGASPAWRAYCWSALRNSTDNLKYVFAWANGPFKQFGKHKMGWQNGLPVLS